MTDSKKVIELLEKIGDKIIEEKEFLTELDKPIGDCDHGINMARGFTEVKKKLETMADSDGNHFQDSGDDSRIYGGRLCRPPLWNSLHENGHGFKRKKGDEL